MHESVFALIVRFHRVATNLVISVITVLKVNQGQEKIRIIILLILTFSLFAYQPAPNTNLIPSALHLNNCNYCTENDTAAFLLVEGENIDDEKYQNYVNTLRDSALYKNTRLLYRAW